MAAAKLATPGFAGGSCAAPASTTRWSATMGSFRYSTRRTLRPFASWKWIWGGTFSAGAGPGCGT